MLRRLAATAALLLSLSAHATPFSSDTSDLWWNPNESGWGVNVVQQGGIQFVTLFVYGANGQATWFVGPDTAFQASSNGTALFTGPLYQTTGPAFAGGFDPKAVGVRQVGNVTITLTTLVSGSLTYSVDGAVVVKDIQRQTWVVENFAGNYLGAATGIYSGACSSTGYQEEPASVAVTQPTTSTFAMTFASASRNCSFTGSYEQDGRMGSAIGSFTCTDGKAGSFGIVEIQATPAAINMRITTTASGCGWQSLYSGARRNF
ncbi:MAG TPA: hypothetical protein VH040_09560 [Usitatibacter sp.]|jgi:hypothetical protein|nr:hypothetical protein [Usitatibacter sp.]